MQSLTPRILVGDDNETYRTVTAAMLRKEGYEVELAVDGNTVVAALAAQEFDLVLLDISMPGLNGLNTARQIRALPPPRGCVPVLAVTAHAMPGDRERCLAAGMDDYLTKPVPPKDLLAMVRRWVRRRPSSGDPEADAAAAASPIDDFALSLLAEQTDPEILPSLVGTFVAEVRSRAPKIAEALAAEDWDGLERQAHALKSASYSFGARYLARCLEGIEAACAVGDTEQARQLALTVPELADAAVENLMAKY
ncbi:MAG: response regulator [Sneathiellaceae bacterium]